MEENTSRYIELLKKKQAEITELEKNPEENKIYQWKNEVLMILDKLITPEARYYKQFDKINYRPSFYGDDPDLNEQNRIQRCKEDLNEANALIKAIAFGVENNLV